MFPILSLFLVLGVNIAIHLSSSLIHLWRSLYQTRRWSRHFPKLTCYVSSTENSPLFLVSIQTSSEVHKFLATKPMHPALSCLAPSLWLCSAPANAFTASLLPLHRVLCHHSQLIPEISAQTFPLLGSILPTALSSVVSVGVGDRAPWPLSTLPSRL